MTNEEKFRLITNGAQQAVAEAIERHRRLGESIVIWRDGEIVTLTADEIPLQFPEPSPQNPAPKK